MGGRGRLAASVAGLGAALALAGCVAPDAGQRSEFLGDVSRLELVRGTEGYAAWVKPGAQLSRYTKVMLDPFEVRAAREPGVRPISPADVARLETYFRQFVMMAVNDAYPVVGTAAPDVLRVRAAITGLRTAPAGQAASDGLEVALSLVGARIESEYRDSVTGERLAAVLDQRDGRQAVTHRSVVASWSEAEAALEAWARLIRARIDMLHRQTAAR